MPILPDIQGIQAIRDQWNSVDFPEDWRSYLGTGVTEYQFWLEGELARLREVAARALAHISDLRDAWQRGAITSHDSQNVARSIRNRDLEIGLRNALPPQPERKTARRKASRCVPAGTLVCPSHTHGPAAGEQSGGRE